MYKALLAVGVTAALGGSLVGCGNAGKVDKAGDTPHAQVSADPSPVAAVIVPASAAELASSSPQDSPVCNASAAQCKQAISEFPPAQPAGPLDNWVKVDNLVKSARGLGTSSNGAPLSAAEQAAIPITAKEMTAAQAGVLLGKEANLDPLLPANREVWVIGVDGYIPRRSADPSSTFAPVLHGYTQIVDAPTGMTIVSLSGVNILQK